MNRSGFTLVEVLISLLIFALIAAAGAAVLSLSIDNKFAIKAASDRTADLQRTRALLRADLGQATARRTPSRSPSPDASIACARAGWWMRPVAPACSSTGSGWSARTRMR